MSNADADALARRPNKVLFGLTLSSNLFFVIGSALYVQMAVISLRFARTYGRGATTVNPSTGEVEVDYTVLYWDQLPSGAKEAAADLGYTQELWDGGAVPEESDEWWQCLSAEHKEAAKRLGYDELEWDGGPAPSGVVCEGSSGEAESEGTPSVESEGTASGVDYDSMAWGELPPDARAAAEALGYTKRLWNSGGTPEEIDVWWDDLTTAQQEAATTLGYDKARWDGVEVGTAEVDADGEKNATREGLLDSDATDDVDNSASADSAPASPDSTDDKKYRNLYIAASWMFIVVGMLDWWREQPKLFPILFVVAGLFGFMSALYVMTNIRLSNIFNAVSVHFFSLEAFSIAWNRSQALQEYPIALVVADSSFVLGSVIEVILSYFYIFDVWADFDMEVNAFNVAAQSLWVICSLIYTMFTLKSWPAGFVGKTVHSKKEIPETFGEEREPYRVDEEMRDEFDPSW